MKTKLSFFLLFIAFSAIGLQAKNSSPEQEINGNQTISSLSLLADTLAIPWREDFESITVADNLPYGMSCTYSKETNKPVRTFIGPNATSLKERVKARNGNNYMVFSATCNDWVFTPGLFLRAGTGYTFSFWCDSMHVSWQTIEAKVGLSPMPESMNIRITDSMMGSEKAGYKKYEGSFVAPKDDIYYFGIHAVNAVANHFLAIDDLEVNTTPPACKTVNLFSRNVTNTSIDFYSVYTPVANHKIILNYRKKGDVTWGFMDVSNQKNVRLSGLTSATDYEACLGVVCSTTDTLWTPISIVKTFADPDVPFPVKLNFDGKDASWYVSNDSISTVIRNYNKWYIDSIGGKIIPGRTVAYISSDGGVSNTYTKKYNNTTEIGTKYFLFPEAEEFFFSFSYRAYTKSNLDYLKVELLDLPAFNIFGILRMDSTMTTKTAILPGTYSNTMKKLVFTWKSNTPGAVNAYAAVIDSVVLRPTTCGTPNELRTRKVSYNGILLSCNAIMGNNASFEIAYKEKDTPESSWMIKEGLLKMDSLLLDGLNPNTNYDIKIRKRYGIDSSFWTPVIQARTALPYTEPGLNEDFENFNTQKSIVLNGTQPNKWMIGSNADGASGKAIYISKDSGGVSNQYENNTASIVHFYLDLDFAQAEAFRLSFDWKGIGSFSDFLRISLIDLVVIPEEGTMLPAENRIFGKDFYSRRTWETEEITFDKTYTGTQKRLVFTWKNIASNGDFQPAIAIDNIRFEAMNCSALENLMVIGSDQSSIALMAKAPETGNTFVVNYKKAGAFEEWFSKTVPQADFFSADKFKLTQLESNTTYEIKVRKQCGSDTSLFTPIVTTRTVQMPATLPLSENFENETSYSKWEMLNEGPANQWMVGNAVANEGAKSLYITNENKITNTYNPSTRSIVHYYRDVKFDKATEYTLSFDWKGGNSNSFMSVYVAGINHPIQSGAFDSKGSFLDGIKYLGATEWKRENIVITRSEQLANSVASLVFTWVCDGTGGEQAPFSIDNIELKAVKCSYPTDLELIDFPVSSTFDKAEIRFSDANGLNNYVISCTNLEDNSTSFVHSNTTQPIITDLQSNTDYEIKVCAICSLGDSSLWSKNITLRMPQKYADFPLDENFEDPNSIKSWTRVNVENGNNWFWGLATYAQGGGNRAVYIDSSDGRTNACKYRASIVHLYRDIDFPASSNDNIFLNFQWKEKSSDTSTNSYLKVSVVDLDVLPVAGAEISNALFTSPNLFSNDENAVWNKSTFILPKNLLLGKKKRLVFSWRNSADSLPTTPVAIDNVVVATPECNEPINLRYKTLSPTSIQLNWTCKYDAKNNFHLEFENNPHLNTNVGIDTFAILKVETNTLYNINVTNECGGKYNFPVTINFRTNQQNPVLPFTEMFDEQEQIKEWTLVNGNNPNKWIIGNIQSTGEGTDIKTAAFVSTDGENNFYYGIDSSKNITSIIHLYRDVFFDSTDKLAVSFDWRAIGNITSDYMKAYFADSNIVPVVNMLVDKKYEIVASDSMNFALKRLWNTEYFTVKGVKNTKKRLIFSWINKQLTKDVIQPPAAISNIHINTVDCTTPMGLSLKNYPDENSVVLTWQNVGDKYKLIYREVGKSLKWDTIEVEKRNFDTLRFDPMAKKNVLYEVHVLNNCDGRSIWSPVFYFNTLQEVGEISFTEDFAEPEKRNQWNTVNGTQLNAWYIDTAVYAKGKGSYSAYISNNGGRTNTYTIFNPESSIVHLYRDIDILPGQKELQLLMDWKGYGQPTKDYMQIYLIHKDSIPKAGKLPLPSTTLLTSKMFHLYKHDWKRENMIIPAPSKVGRNRLVFTWINNNMDGEQSPAAIDNIAVNMSTCLSPINTASTAISQDSIALKWNTQKEAYDYFNLRYRKIESEIWEEKRITYDSNYVLRNLTANRLYEIQIQTQCPFDTSVWRPYFVQTKQIPVGLPLDEDFESDTAQHSWVFCNGEMPNAWYIGLGGNLSKKSIYISDEGGYTYNYVGILPAGPISHFYKNITFQPAVEYLLSYQWNSVGESTDYLQVFLTDTNKAVTAGIAIATADKLSEPLYESVGWISAGTLLSPDKVSGKTKRLVFSWITNTARAFQTPAAVDNISLRALDCKTPTNVKVLDYPDLHSAVISWSSKGDTFTIAYGKATEDPQTWTKIGVKKDTTITLQGLDSNTLYYAAVENSCSEKTIFTNTVIVRTVNTPITEFPYTETFEKDSTTKDKWNIRNGSFENAWCIGKNVAAKGGEQSMYISSNDGDSNFYYHQNSAITHFYRDITFPKSGNIEMSFDWKSAGFLPYDYLRVSLIDIVEDPTPGDSTKGPLKTYVTTSGTPTWETATILFQDTTLRGKRKRIVFTWKNSYRYNPHLPPAAVDNITFTWFNCSSVQNLQSKTVSDKQVALSWTGASGAKDYTISYKKLLDKSWTSKDVVNTKDTLDGLESNTTYLFRVALNCDAGFSRLIYDTALLAASIPFIEDFDTVPVGNWIRCTTSTKLSNSFVSLYPGKGNWNTGYFVNVANASKAAKKSIRYGGYDWLVSPQIYLPHGIKTELEFNLGLTFYNHPEGAPDEAAIGDRFVILISKEDNKWSDKDALLTWDNTGYNLEYNEISHTREGDKIKISLENYSGPVRIAFYSETGTKAYNDVFIDSVIVRPIVCEKVQDVHVSKIGLDSAFVAWTAPKEQYEWQVQCATMDGTLLQTDELLELYNVELKALQMNTEYNVSVRSICNENDTSDWFIKEFTTKSTCANSPSAIEIVPTDSNAIVNWIADTEHVSWELRYGFSGQPKEQMISIFTITPSYEIKNLPELTAYELYIRAVCETNDTSNWADMKTFTTQRKTCFGVSNIAITEIQVNSAVVTWEAPQGQRQWEVRYGTENISINAMKSYFTVEKTLPASSLQVNATYEIVVRSICRADDSSLWSARKQFTTQDCGTVSNLLVVKNTNGNSAKLSWTAKPEHTKWRIGIDTNNNFSTAREEEITENPYTIDYAHWSIEKAKSYYISIKALCGSHLVDTWSDQAVLTKGEGIDDLDNARIQVNLSPNPANDYTKLSIYGAEGVVNVQIYSVKGELILTEKLNCTPENTKDLVIKGLQRGAYTLRIVHEKWTRTEKLIMQ